MRRPPKPKCQEEREKLEPRSPSSRAKARRAAKPPQTTAPGHSSETTPTSGPSRPSAETAPSGLPPGGVGVAAEPSARARAPARAYRALLVDDHVVVRHGLRALLASQPGIEICGEASTGPEAVEMVRRETPDLVVLDLTLPEINGLDVMDAIRQESPTTDILVLTMHFSEELAREVLRSGALGYVLKSDADKDLLAAVDHVRHRQPFFTSRLANAMAQTFVANPSVIQGNGPLTQREVEVVTLLAEGKSNKEAAAALNVSTRTVESHRHHIMHKMGFTNFSELVRFAIRSNLVAP